MGSGAVSWSSKLQPIVALSTTEAEYVAACAAGKEIRWMQHRILTSYHHHLPLFPHSAPLPRSSPQPSSHCDLLSNTSDSPPLSLRWRRPSLMGPLAFPPFLPLLLLCQTTPPGEGRALPPWSPFFLSILSPLLPPLALAKKFSPRMAWPPFLSQWMTSTRTPRVTTLLPRVKNAKPITASAVFARNLACGPDTPKPCKR